MDLEIYPRYSRSCGADGSPVPAWASKALAFCCGPGGKCCAMCLPPASLSALIGWWQWGRRLILVLLMYLQNCHSQAINSMVAGQTPSSTVLQGFPSLRPGQWNRFEACGQCIATAKLLNNYVIPAALFLHSGSGSGGFPEPCGRSIAICQAVGQIVSARQGRHRQ